VTEPKKPCTYVVASPETGCDLRWWDLQALELDISSPGCAVDSSYGNGPWLSLYAFENNQWTGTREVDFLETARGGTPGAGTDSINTNFDGHPTQKTWKDEQGRGFLLQSRGWSQHVSVRFDQDGGGVCPMPQQGVPPTILVSVKHCDNRNRNPDPFSGNVNKTCYDPGEQVDCSAADTSCSCIPFNKDADVKFVLDIWDGGITKNCEVTAAPVYYTKR
jgi:hypothetical protein